MRTWLFPGILLTLVDSILFYLLFALFFPKRFSRKWMEGASLFLLLIVQIIKSSLPISSQSMLVLSACIGLLAALLLFRGKFMDKLLSMLLLLVFLFVTEAAAYGLFSLTGLPPDALTENVTLLVLGVFSRALLPPLFLCFRRLYRKKLYPGVGNKGIKLLLFTPIPVMICVVMLVYSPYAGTQEQPAGLFSLCIFGLIAAMAYILALVARIVKERTLTERILSLEQYTAMSEEHIKTLGAAYKNVQGTIHDIGNHLDYLTATGRSSDYAANVKNKLHQGLGDTGNYDIDAILSFKRKNLPKHITLSVKGRLPYILPWLEAVDIVTLLGNALDNAVEALAQTGGTIQVGLDYDGNSLVFRVKNPCGGNVKKPSGRFQSTKQMPGHGFGISNMQAVTEQYQGNFQIDITDNMFVVTVILQSGSK